MKGHPFNAKKSNVYSNNKNDFIPPKFDETDDDILDDIKYDIDMSDRARGKWNE